MPVAAAPNIELKNVELFASGFQTDSNQNSREWLEAELDEIVAAYNEVAGTKHDAPIVIHHDGKVSQGWLAKVYKDGQILKGDYKKVDSQFAAEANAGRFVKRSISIYPRNDPHNPTPGRLNLRHVAYVPSPAVKGLKDHADFSEGDRLVYVDFAELSPMWFGSPFEAIAHILQKMRDRTIASDGVEVADTQLPQSAIDAVKQAIGRGWVEESIFYSAIDSLRMDVDRLRDQAAFQSAKSTSYSEAMTTTPTTPTASADPTSSELEALRNQIAAQNQTIAQMSTERERDRVSSFVENLVHDRRLAPADKAGVIELALAIDHTKPVEFSESGAGTVTPRDRYLQQLADRKPMVSTQNMPTDPANAPDSFSEVESQTMNLDNVSLESAKLDRQIRAYMDKHAISYSEAVDRLNIIL